MPQLFFVCASLLFLLGSFITVKTARGKPVTRWWFRNSDGWFSTGRYVGWAALFFAACLVAAIAFNWWLAAIPLIAASATQFFRANQNNNLREGR